MVMALAVTMLLSVFAPRPLPCPSAITNENPPRGRSICSIVSPLSDDAYLPTFATATCTSSIRPPSSDVVPGGQDHTTPRSGVASYSGSSGAMHSPGHRARKVERWPIAAEEGQEFDIAGGARDRRARQAPWREPYGSGEAEHLVKDAPVHLWVADYSSFADITWSCLELG